MNRTERIRIAALVFLCVVAPLALTPTASAGEAAPIDDAWLDRVVWPEEEVTSDRDALFERFLGELRADPEHPLAELLIVRMQSLMRPRHLRQQLFDALGEILESDVRTPLHRSLFESERLRLAITLAVDVPELEARVRERYVSEWWAIGPFGVRSVDCLDWTFGIEESAITSALDLGTAVPTPWGARSWTPVPELEEGGEVELSGLVDLAYGAGYALTQFELEEARPVVLELLCADSFRLWFNGDAAIEADRVRGQDQVQYRVVVAGRPGQNRVLLKLSGIAATRFSLRLHEADGRPLARLPMGDTRSLSAIAARPAGGEAPAIEFEDARARLAGNTDGKARRLAALAWLELARGNNLRNFELVKEAAEAATDMPNAFLDLASALGRTNVLPDTVQRNEVRGAYERALKLAPRCASALVWLAIDRHRQGDSAAAFKDLVQARSLAPRNPDVDLLLATLCRARGWDRERRQYMESAIAKGADDSEVLNDAADWHNEERRPLDALAMTEASLEADADQPRVRARLISLALQTGDEDRARELLEEDIASAPRDASARMKFARFLSDAGARDEARSVLVECVDRFPQDARFPMAIGDLALAEGDTATARTWYQKLLDMRPESHRAREALNRLEGRSADPLFEEYRLATEPILARARTHDYAAEYPRAGSVALLDDLVLRFYEDGSSRMITHQLFLILNEEGIEQHGTMRPRGTLHELRTIRPGGEILEPISLGTGEYTMPGLEPGAVVEWIYEERLPSLEGNPVRMPKFYFQDIDMKMPFVRSRYVVIEPEGLDLQHLRLNYPWEPEVTRRDGDVIRIYDVLDLGQLKPEPGMPDPEENVPQVVLVEPRSWKEVNQEFRLQSKVRVTGVVRQVAGTWVENVSGQAAQARLLYERINEWVRAPQGSGLPTHTLLERRGPRLPLYMAMLEALGIEYDYGRARRSPELDLDNPSWTWVRADLFPNPLVRVRPDDGPATWVALGARNQPYGEIPGRLFGAPVFVVDEGDGTIDYLPLTPSENEIRLSSEVDLYPEADGYRGRIRIRFPSGMGAYLKERLRDMTTRESEAVQLNLVQGYLPGSRLEKGSFEGLGEVGRPLVFDGEVRSEGEMQQDGRNMLAFRLGFASMNLVQRLSTPGEREHAMLVDSHDFRSDVMRIHLGDDFRVVTLPEDIELDHPLGFYRLESRQKPTRVDITRTVNFGPARITPKAYPELMKLSREIDDRESDRIWILPMLPPEDEDGDDD